jgi:hypothetical protein
LRDWDQIDDVYKGKALPGWNHDEGNGTYATLEPTEIV